MKNSWVTDDMRNIIGQIMRESVSYPVSTSDIRKWAISVYYPEKPPRLFWDNKYASTTKYGGIVAPEKFNPFAWGICSIQLYLTNGAINLTSG